MNKFLFIFMLFFPLSSQGFEKKGHEVICWMAYQQLTNIAQQKVNEIMSTDETYNNNDPAKSFAESCNWAEEMKIKANQFVNEKDLAKKKLLQPFEKYIKYTSYHYLDLMGSEDNFGQESTSENSMPEAVYDKNLGYMLEGNPLLELKGDKLSELTELELLKIIGHWYGDLWRPFRLSYYNNNGVFDIPEHEDEDCLKFANGKVYNPCLMKMYLYDDATGDHYQFASDLLANPPDIMDKIKNGRLDTLTVMIFGLGTGLTRRTLLDMCKDRKCLDNWATEKGAEGYFLILDDSMTRLRIQLSAYALARTLSEAFQ